MKKRTKKLLVVGASRCPNARVKWQKFLLLFSKRSSSFLLSVALSACAAPQACLLPTQTKMLLVDLYFGRDIPGRAPLTDAEWAAFARAEITPRFPDGFTVIDAHGQWLDPGTHTIGAEGSIMVRIAAPTNVDLGQRVDAIANAYRKRFHQLAVGITSAPACGAF